MNLVSRFKFVLSRCVKIRLFLCLFVGLLGFFSPLSNWCSTKDSFKIAPLLCLVLDCSTVCLVLMGFNLPVTILFFFSLEGIVGMCYISSSEEVRKELHEFVHFSQTSFWQKCIKMCPFMSRLRYCLIP